jgi:hypothetical protein
LKIIHGVSIASLIIALGLLVAGFSEIAGLIIGLVTAVEILFSIFTGKQTNDGAS